MQEDSAECGREVGEEPKGHRSHRQVLPLKPFEVYHISYLDWARPSEMDMRHVG